MSSSPSPPTYSSVPLPDLLSRSQIHSPMPRPASMAHRKSSTIIQMDDEVPLSPVTTPSRPSSTQRSASAALLSTPGSSGRSTPVSRAVTPSHDLFESVRLQTRRPSEISSAAEEGESSPLLAGEQDTRKWYQTPMFIAGVKLVVMFVVFTGVLVGTFYFGMPKVDPEDKDAIKLPKSFQDLLALNALFQKYKRNYPLRLMACGVVAYLFVQMFSLPGSMYISILFGAAYGMIIGLLLSCLCDAFGSVLCYTLSAIVAPPLLELPFYRARVETWRKKIMGDPNSAKGISWGDVFAFLVVLRISPVPPHWVANFVAPHLGIGVALFWLSCFIGIAPVSVIHVTIGSSLHTMTSAADFHILSLRNILGLVAVIVAVLIPVALKRIFKKDLGDLDEAEAAIEEEAPDSASIDVPIDGHTVRYQAVDSGVVLAGPSRGDDSLDTGLQPKNKGKGRALEIIADAVEPDEEDQEDLTEVYQMAAPLSREKRMRGYGAIEPAEGERVRTSGPAPWWPFAR